MNRIEQHFSKIAGNYAKLRTTDIEPILFIKHRLSHKARIKAADIGCGTGRYDVKMCQYLKNVILLVGIDTSQNMLKEIVKKHKNVLPVQFRLINASSENLPIATNRLDCIFSFNALHHFRLKKFLNEASRILKHDGALFIYTRLRHQNCRTIWGKYFPGFCEQENRLIEIDQLHASLSRIKSLQLEAIKIFKYPRKQNLNRLLTCARNHHYSTFCLYDKEEFEEAFRRFKYNLIHQFDNLNDIRWIDENIMFLIKKTRG